MSRGIELVTKSIKKLTKKSKTIISKMELTHCRKNKRVFQTFYPDDEINRNINESNINNIKSSFEIDSIDYEFLKELEMLDLILEQYE